MPELVNHGTHCAPNEPAPTPQREHDAHPCDGVLRIECCCPPQLLLHSAFDVIEVGPMSDPDTAALLSNTGQAIIDAGYVLLGVTVTDTGAGNRVVIIYGWYA